MEEISNPTENNKVPYGNFYIVYNSETKEGIIWIQESLEEDNEPFVHSKVGTLVIGTKEELEQFIIDNNILNPEEE